MRNKRVEKGKERRRERERGKEGRRNEFSIVNITYKSSFL